MEQKTQFEHQLDPEGYFFPIPSRSRCCLKEPSADSFGVRTATSM